MTVLGAAVSLASPEARGASMAECLAANRNAQLAMRDDKLIEARRELLVCSQEGCPDVVKHDCAQWLTETDAAVPSVVLGAKGTDGRNRMDVRVAMDGTSLVTRLDERPVAVNPGVHEFRFQDDQGDVAVVTTAVRKGEKDRLLSVQLERASTPALVAVQPQSSTEKKTSSSRLIGVVGLGALGIAGMAGFTYFGLSGLSKRSDLIDASCAPTCAHSDVDAIRKDYRLADVSLGVGVLSLAAAGYLFFSTSSKSSTTVTIQPVRGGAAAGYAQTF